MKLIGLTGPAGCGKDTVANHLEHTHCYYCLSFAEPIKAALMEMLDESPEIFYDRELKEKPLHCIGKSPRQLMQTLGTEWGRNIINPDIWVILLERRLEIHSIIYKRFVIPDIRFENEAALIRKHGGAIWRITRPNNPHNIDKTHASEQPIKLFTDDIEIVNGAGIEDLRTIIDSLLIEEETA